MSEKSTDVLITHKDTNSFTPTHSNIQTVYVTLDTQNASITDHFCRCQFIPRYYIKHKQRLLKEPWTSNAVYSICKGECFNLKCFFYKLFTQSHMCLHFRQLQDHERLKNSEVEELLARVSTLEAERKTLLLDKTNLNTDIKHMETELQLSQQANRCTHSSTFEHTHANIQKRLLMCRVLSFVSVSLPLSLVCMYG